MILTIEITKVVEDNLRARAASEGRPMEELASALLAKMTDPNADEDWLDHEYHAACEADTSPVCSLEEVRAMLAKIPGSMTADFIAERDER